MTDDLDALADGFEGFAAWCEGASPLYERLARGVADDPELLELALLLAGRDDPLTEYYPTVTEDPRDPSPGRSTGGRSRSSRSVRAWA